MKSSFANDVRNVESQSQTAVENWRAQEGSRIRAVYPLPDSVVKSAGHQEEWCNFSRHIEIAVADGLPFFAQVESERVTDSLGRELRRSAPRNKVAGVEFGYSAEMTVGQSMAERVDAI